MWELEEALFPPCEEVIAVAICGGVGVGGVDLGS